MLAPAPPPVVIPAPAPRDPHLILPGTVEDGVHSGYLTDVEGMYQLTFDRVDVQPDGSWTNTNAKLRTLPTDPNVWTFGYRDAGQSVEIVIQDQRVTGISESWPLDSCGC